MKKDEDLLKQKVREVLAPDFVMKEEVWGRHLLSTHKPNYDDDGNPLRIDFLIMPKMPLIQAGFFEPLGYEAWIGIEVKHCPEGGSNAKGIQVAYQAHTYAESLFGELGRPPFVLIYPPVKEFLQPGIGYPGATLFGQFLQKGNVGALEIWEDRYTLNRTGGKPVWRMVVGNCIWWDSEEGPGKTRNGAIKRNYGTWKS